jgi:deazaflavin-dependent oxidoreductase (nitroreductase family)
MCAQDVRSKPRGLLRWLFRVPVWMFRLGLGGFMPWWIMLTTVGRKSGIPRRAVVDIVQRDGDKIYIVAGYGRHADWVRNLKANPSLKGQIGWSKFDAEAVFLEEADKSAFLLDLYRRRPTYARSATRAIGIKLENEDDVRTAASKMLVLQIRKASAC